MDLERFIRAQVQSYDEALAEIKSGKKRSHWMWFIFPQIAGLGFSDMAKHYAIRNTEEAAAYLKHPVLGKRLIEISTALLKHKSQSANQIFGSPDDMKLKSSMTLFSQVNEANPIFQFILNEFFHGENDQKTLDLIG